MPMRSPAGFISAFFDPLKNPNAPTIGTATAGDATAVVTFTAPADVGGSAITAYYAVSNPDQITTSGASSPITATGLTNGTAYTFNVWALNTYGPGVWSAATGSVTPAAPRGLFGGGNFAGGSTIQYITISSLGNATSFGTLPSTSQYVGACSSSTRALFLITAETINYVTIATTGNAASFGNAYNQGGIAYQGVPGCSNSTTGLWNGGLNNAQSDFINTISYSTIATLGAGTYFGDLTVKRNAASACASPTRGIFAGGYNFGNIASINYSTIATTGNATNFGNLLNARTQGAGLSSSTRGIFGGDTAEITYITIATTGNSVSFGSLLASVESVGGCSSETRGVFGGSYPSSNVLQYVTIATTGNSIDFGDLLNAGGGWAGCSSAHGGLQ